MSAEKSAFDVEVTGSVEAPESVPPPEPELPPDEPPHAAAARARNAMRAAAARATAGMLFAARAGELEQLAQHPVHVGAAVEAEVPLGVQRPLGGVAVPRELEAVAIGVAQVQGLVRAVVIGAVERPVCADEPAEGIGKRLARRVADRDVIQTRRSG